METNQEPLSSPEEEPLSEETVEIQEPAEAEVPAEAAEPVKNLDICPNCLEPNPDNLAVCPFCGQPLHPDVEVSAEEMPENPETLEANRQEALEAQQEDKKQVRENGFRRVMPYLGCYLIIDAIFNLIELSRQEELEQPLLAYSSYLIFMAAGVLMAWPLIKKGINRLRPGTFKIDEPEEDAEPAGEDAEENAVPESAEEPAEESEGEPEDKASGDDDEQQESEEE